MVRSQLFEQFGPHETVRRNALALFVKLWNPMRLPRNRNRRMGVDHPTKHRRARSRGADDKYVGVWWFSELFHSTRGAMDVMIEAVIVGRQKLRLVLAMPDIAGLKCRNAVTNDPCSSLCVFQQFV